MASRVSASGIGWLEPSAFWLPSLPHGLCILRSGVVCDGTAAVPVFRDLNWKRDFGPSFPVVALSFSVRALIA